MNSKGIKVQLFGISLILISISFWNLAGGGFKYELISSILLILGTLISIIGFIKKN